MNFLSRFHDATKQAECLVDLADPRARCWVAMSSLLERPIRDGWSTGHHVLVPLQAYLVISRDPAYTLGFGIQLGMVALDHFKTVSTGQPAAAILVLDPTCHEVAGSPDRFRIFAGVAIAY